MIPKADFFSQIEDYCLDLLNEKERTDFEKELKFNGELKEEVQFQLDIQSAINEKEILALREQLRQIAANRIPADTSFELLNDFSNIKEITASLTPEDLINFYDSLPKVHVYHHNLVSGENVHKFYLEQEKTGLNGDDEEIIDDFFPEAGLEGWEEAIMEQDIMNLRDTLSYVAKSVQPHYSSEDIINYINGELSAEETEAFETELSQNGLLSAELKLYLDVDTALKESDVMVLRDKMSNIMATETSGKYSSLQIENFIDGQLNENEFRAFVSEMDENSDLLSEVQLRRNVNNATGEKDIIELRDQLKSLSSNLGNLDMKTMVPEKIVRFRLSNIWKQSVAVVIILIGMSGVLNMGITSSDQLYLKYFNSPEISSVRSVSAETGLFNEANLCYVKGEYEKAIELYNKALVTENEKFVYHFYKAASLQNLSRFQEAIPEYSRVINHGDNLFVEEAEWNRCLCYMKLENHETAKHELLAIVERNGFYKKEAKAILQRMRFSFK